jgi:hypothetical protein
MGGGMRSRPCSASIRGPRPAVRVVASAKLCSPFASQLVVSRPSAGAGASLIDCPSLERRSDDPNRRPTHRPDRRTDRSEVRCSHSLRIPRRICAKGRVAARPRLSFACTILMLHSTG